MFVSCNLKLIMCRFYLNFSLVSFKLKLTYLHFCQIRRKLSPILNDAKAPFDVIAFTAISLGLVYVGSCNEEVAQAIIFALMDRSESELGEPLTRLLPLGLGLLYLGKQVNSLLLEGLLYISILVFFSSIWDHGFFFSTSLTISVFSSCIVNFPVWPRIITSTMRTSYE